jgi:hypothetical protein
MIYINHGKKIIFIHIPKTGGSYISQTLVKYYGFVSYLNIIINKRPDHNDVCKIYEYKKALTGNLLYDNTFFNKVIGILVYCKTSDYLNLLMNMDNEKWKTYKKFCFIRNPYDRVYSGWNHINITLNKKTDFFNYISQNKYNVSDIEYAHIFMNQKTQIQDEDGSCGVDLIGRFEYLEEDFQKILKLLGFNEIKHIEKKVNSSSREKNNQLVFDVKTIRRLNEICLDDLDMFNYKKIDL